MFLWMNVVSATAPIAPAQGKVKLPMLLRNPGFVATLFAHGGKATEQVMRAEAAKLGYGGDAASSDLF
jgi:hypothetical protein